MRSGTKMTTIRDGTGNSTFAKVTTDNKLSVKGEVASGIAAASLERQGAFSFNSRVQITANTGATSTLCHIQNNSTTSLVVAGIYASTTQAGLWTMYRNPTGGTILSSGTLTDAVQLNFGSAREFNGLFYVGATGLTTTGGTAVALGYTVAGFAVLPLDGAIVMPTSATLSLAFTNNSGTNASVTFSVVAAYVE